MRKGVCEEGKWRFVKTWIHMWEVRKKSLWREGMLARGQAASLHQELMESHGPCRKTMAGTKKVPEES
jgi:hypothetical protein